MIGQASCALLLIGYQKDYFASDGILNAVIEENVQENAVLANTIRLLEELAPTAAPIINLPILFSPDYHELNKPTGLLAKIKEVGAFRRDTEGGKVIPELLAFGDRIQHLNGKTGFNGFLGTGLEEVLREAGVDEVVLAGVVTSVCIDSTGRAAAERGFDVTVLSDVTAGRGKTEQDFYCENVFPLYARVETSGEFLARVREPATA